MPSLPSAVWTPTGADPARLLPAKQDAFDRMDPIAGMGLLEARYGPLQVPSVEPAGEGEGYSAEEVADALAYEGPLYGGVKGWEAEGWILGERGEVEMLKGEGGRLDGENEGLRAEVERLREEREEVQWWRGVARSSRRRREVGTVLGVEGGRKQERIREHVAGYMRELRREVEMAEAAVEGKRKVNEWLEGEVRALKEEIEGACRAMGKRGVEEVRAEYKALMEEEMSAAFSGC